jgi:hypothetical protein
MNGMTGISCSQKTLKQLEEEEGEGGGGDL